MATNYSLPAGQWVAIATGIGSGSIHHSAGRGQVIYVISETVPPAFSENTTLFNRTTQQEIIKYGLLTAQETIYALAISVDAVVANTPTRGAETLLSDLTTARGTEEARFKVDSQPTSYEQGLQFKIFHRFVDTPATTQIAFKFSSIYDLNILSRALRGAEGGREYLVIPNDGSYTTQDALITTPVTVGRVNNQVKTTTSGVTVSFGLLTGANQFVIGDTDQFPNGDMFLTDGNNNRANTATTADSNKSGVAEGEEFFLVFDHLGQSNPTRMQFFLQWEERQGD